MDQNEEHLRLLSIFHYVVGGLAGLFSLFPVLHLVIGLAMLLGPEKFESHGDPVPSALGWFFVILPGVMITIGLTLAGCIIAAGRFLAQRRWYTFCLVMAGAECIFMPFGTVLGVFTILVLTRNPVKQLFGVSPTAS